MPKCLNDPKRYYRGDEPSPKGLGYCAHAARAGARKRGRDGAWWVARDHVTGAGTRVRAWKPAGVAGRRDAAARKKGTDVWGLNRPLERLWRKLASGDWIVIVSVDGKQKMLRQPKTGAARIRSYKKLRQDPDIQALIMASSSPDCYERLYKKVKGASPAAVLRHYTKHLSHHGADKEWYLC